MSLIDLYINDGGNIRRIGDNPHDMLMIWKGKLWYHNLQNGDGCRLGEESEWYSFVENADEYGYNCDPRKTENSSEFPNNCEHITEDGVTCAKYPACDDCLDNPLNKVKGSERLIKGSESPNNCEDEKCNNCMHMVFDGYWYGECRECKYEPKDESQTYITEDRDTQILDAWQVHHRSTTCVEDEPHNCPYYPCTVWDEMAFTMERSE